MKHILPLILIVAAIFPLSARRKVNTLRPQLTPLSVVEELQQTGPADTLRYADRITFSGYSKALNDANETFFVTNETPFHISRLCVKFTYSTPDGTMIHEEFHDINCDIPAAATRQISVRSFDRQHNFYYYLGKKPKRSATPYKVAYTLLSYDVKITVGAGQ